jgi:hypothetical protein
MESIIGKTFGCLTIIKETERPKDLKTKDKWYECKCLECGKYSKVNGRSIKRGRRSFCECNRNKNRSKKLKNLNVKDLKGKIFGLMKVICDSGEREQGSVIWKCECINCGKFYNRRGSFLINGYQNSCRCAITGSNHYRWRSDYTFNDRSSRRSFTQLIKWRKKVYLRDNYKCWVCGDNVGGNLVAHHLDGWDNFKKKRFFVKNGVTLCESCHIEFHELYGFGDNTKNQFYEYLKIKGK